MPPIQVAQAEILGRVVKLIISQRRIEHIHAHTVGKLHGSSPIILLHGLFAPLILAAQQPVGSFGGSTGHDIGYIHRHAGENHHTMTALGVNVRTRLYEVARAPDADVAHGRDAVGIVITGIDDGNGHSFAPKSGLMQFVTTTLGDLGNGRAIDAIGVNGGLIDE